MSSIDYIGYIYALTVAAGGLIGFLKAGSVISLVSGLSFGALIGVGALQVSQSPSSHVLMLCASGLLSAVMGFRFYNSHKFMPAGLVFCLSALMLARSLYGILAA